MSLTIFPSKLDTSQIFLDFNFLSLLAAGETITGTSVTAITNSGTDLNPQVIVSGVAVIAGPIVSQKIINGVVGTMYLINCTISTSLGNTVLLQGYLAIIDSNPFQS